MFDSKLQIGRRNLWAQWKWNLSDAWGNIAKDPGIEFLNHNQELKQEWCMHYSSSIPKTYTFSFSAPTLFMLAVLRWLQFPNAGIWINWLMRVFFNLISAHCTAFSLGVFGQLAEIGIKFLNWLTPRIKTSGNSGEDPSISYTMEGELRI